MTKFIQQTTKEIFDAIIIIALFSLSLVSIIGFVPMFVGVCGYFTSPRDDRKLITIFQTIIAGGKTLISFSILATIAMMISILNISFAKYLEGMIVNVMLFSSWIVLSLSIWLILFVSPIIVRMNVSMKHLLVNAAIVSVTSGFKSLLIVIFAGSCVYIGLVFPYVLGILIYFLCLINTSVCNLTIDQLKRKGEQHYEKTI